MTTVTPQNQDQLRRCLRAVGLRVTAPRLAVLEWVAVHPHDTADRIVVGARERLGAVSTQAVYDVLNTYTRVGLLRKIEPSGHSARFETRTGDNHHHLVCRECGQINDVDCVVGAAPCLDPSDTSGFALDEAEVLFWGLCPGCQRNPDVAKKLADQPNDHKEEV